jgi:chromatin remodeling complex protein RSC6
MAEKKAAGGARGGIAKPVTPSPELAEIVGKNDLPRSEIVSKMWDHIKKNNLQNPENKREILADDKLEKIFGTKKVTMFEMNKHISKHVK